ncbi:MAG TPA: hypothetical protein ENJ50_01500 [Planctomycetaceae bacterium]|nr:hypothetical protein [Planctomycetaceae bacterium]
MTTTYDYDSRGRKIRQGSWGWICLSIYFAYFIAIAILRNAIPMILGHGIAEQFGWPIVFFTSDHFERFGVDESLVSQYLTVRSVRWTPHSLSLLAINMAICAALAAAFATALHQVVILLTRSYPRRQCLIACAMFVVAFSVLAILDDSALFMITPWFFVGDTSGPIAFAIILAIYAFPFALCLAICQVARVAGQRVESMLRLSHTNDRHHDAIRPTMPFGTRWGFASTILVLVVAIQGLLYATMYCAESGSFPAPASVSRGGLLSPCGWPIAFGGLTGDALSKSRLPAHLLTRLATLYPMGFIVDGLTVVIASLVVVSALRGVLRRLGIELDSLNGLFATTILAAVLLSEQMRFRRWRFPLGDFDIDGKDLSIAIAISFTWYMWLGVGAVAVVFRTWSWTTRRFATWRAKEKRNQRVSQNGARGDNDSPKSDE